MKRKIIKIIKIKSTMKGDTWYSTSLAFFDEKVEVLETFAARVKIFVNIRNKMLIASPERLGP